METTILQARRDIKKQGRAMVRSHYPLLAFLCILLLLSGEEFSLLRTGLGFTRKLPDVINRQEAVELPSASLVLQMMLEGRIAQGEELAQAMEELSWEAEQTGAFSRTQGVFAAAVNALSSGSLYMRLSQLIYSLTQSDRAVQILFILGVLLWSLFSYLFLKNVLSVCARRSFLEARVYEKIKPSGTFRVVMTKRWLKVVRALMIRDLCLFFWSLTIVGGVIKTYSYWAVPYILAENPDLSARQAIGLSKRMMVGHKKEVFLFHLSMAGWILLGFFSAGFTDMAFGAPYRLACYTEVYARIRQEAKRKGIAGTELLNDRYLFEKADRITLAETYFDVVDELTCAMETRIPLQGARRVFSEWFGIWLGSLKSKRAHDQGEARFAVALARRDQMVGDSYPHRLDPLYHPHPERKGHGFYYLRDYSVWTLILFFLMCACIGWIWEVSLHYLQTGELVNRGVLLGPWLPIYGAGATMVLCLCNRFRKQPALEFFVATAVCGVMEYGTSVYLEMVYHERWWSYEGYFLNLHGRICAEGLLVFGAGCMLVIYLLAPLFDYLLQRMKLGVLRILSLILLILFVADMGYSSIHPNMAAGAVEGAAKERTDAS